MAKLKIDMRSDTATLPNDEMKEATKYALLGDDILGEDPTVKKLEQLASSMLGMGDALLTISGTMSNQIAVMALTERGDEVIVGEDAHLYNLEGGGLASLSQVQVRAVPVKGGHYDCEQIENAIQLEGIQAPETGLLCLENTYNLNEGAVTTLENMRDIRELSNKYNIPVYLDGARLFNAAAHLNVDPAEICMHVDAVQFCLTKGLGCPLGSMLLGSKSFIQKARKLRQRLGGGMRQAGIVAAPGLYALTHMVDRIQDDHTNAKKLFEGLNKIPGIKMCSDSIQTNIVSLEITKERFDADQLINHLKEKRIYVKKIGNRKIRLVTHYQISMEDIDAVLKSFYEIFNS